MAKQDSNLHSLFGLSPAAIASVRYASAIPPLASHLQFLVITTTISRHNVQAFELR